MIIREGEIAMSFNNKDDQLINLIKRLPKVRDNRTKEEVLQAIPSEQMRKKNKLIPIFSALSVALAICIGFIIFDDSIFTIEEKTSEKIETYTAVEESEDSLIINEEEALMNDLNALKKEESLPDNVQFTIEIEDNQLSFVFKDDTMIYDERQYERWIESILLIAKSYRFHSVHFKNASLEQVGRYNISEPIQVK